MSNEKDRELALSIPLGVSCVCDIAHAGSICDKHQRIAAALATVRAEEKEAAFKEAARIARAMAAGETNETGRQKALNIAAALESTLTEK